MKNCFNKPFLYFQEIDMILNLEESCRNEYSEYYASESEFSHQAGSARQGLIGCFAL